MPLQGPSFIVDLEGLGKQFFNTILSLGIDNNIVDSTATLHGPLSPAMFVYRESFTQILLHMDANPTLFFSKLVSSPDLNMFRHIPVFSDQVKTDHFCDTFRSLGINIMNLIRTKVGLSDSFDYYLENCTFSYMVVTTIQKGS